jgi:putative hydrolases of HD superfamily
VQSPITNLQSLSPVYDIVNVNSFIELFDKINDLKQLPRTGWLLAGVSSPESVADHCYATTMLALVVAEVVNADWLGQGLLQPLMVDRVLRIALVHDLAESIVTDLPKRSTELIGRSVKHEAEAQAITQIFYTLPSGGSYIQLWHEYDAASTPEARLVRDADKLDKLEMVYQALRYEQRGHRNLDEFWQGHTWHYPACLAFYEQLLQRRSK